MQKLIIIMFLSFSLSAKSIKNGKGLVEIIEIDKSSTVESLKISTPQFGLCMSDYKYPLSMEEIKKTTNCYDVAFINLAYLNFTTCKKIKNINCTTRIENSEVVNSRVIGRCICKI